MKRVIGTSVYGLRAPIVKAHDPLVKIVTETLKSAVTNHNLQLHANDVLAVTESMVARCQNNYCSLDDITQDLNQKFEDHIGVVFPITSRNRFANIMKAIARTEKKISLFLSYPSDEVGNSLFDKEVLLDLNINPSTDVLTEEKYREIIAHQGKHLFTGVNYVDLYKSFAVNDNITVYLVNDPHQIVKICDQLLIANIHDRDYYKKLFTKLGAKKVYNLADVLSEKSDTHGYNEEYGLYGSNYASENTLKLFPRDAQKFVEELQKSVAEEMGVTLHVMVYGDGAFKDPKGHIWELADPVVSPGYTSGLSGTPNELKIKYVADNLTDSDLDEAIKREIKKKDSDLTGKDLGLGTTPRHFSDLLGSLADLTSGSGDKGTPIILVQGYFDNYSVE